ncbi:glycosyltransferase [Thermoleptolyngbya sp. C42_A2020_037]|uniref:glycosyltransferase n=1 Tax=Thermoleptolyngbya sp. C42_A2020_037 TaxID=2747799 RepID=UPI0019ED60F5|nr:glycosyltransferase [Thermoleptolyngbya sp. C42_A2020_037]MBF2086843.1 glycosyltransferase [Thermoleptolyngbya sp. C42_A2020_037]
MSQTPPVSQSRHPRATFSAGPQRQAIALILVHNDPALEFQREEASGSRVYVNQISEALAKLGWQVDVFTRKTNPDDPTIVQHSPHHRTIRLVAGPQEFIPRDRLLEHMPAFVEAFRKFQTKDGFHYPLVHTHYWLAGWVGLQLKQESNIQLVHTYHSLAAVKYAGMAQKPLVADHRMAVERHTLVGANCVVATSPQEQETLRELVATPGNVQVIPGGTDLDVFHQMSRSDARAQLGLSPSENVVLHVGRFDPRKGIETLVRACAQIQQMDTLAGEPLRLLLVGAADDAESLAERDRIQSLVTELGLYAVTEFVGQVGHDRLPLYYTAADVCVVPSQFEPFGLVALESMACGTPVVASDVGGLKFAVVPEETGLLVAPQDVDGFAGAIARILSDDLWAHRLRRQASLRVQQNFSWSAVAARLSDLYRRLLAQSLTGDLLSVPMASSTAAALSSLPAEPLEQPLVNVS